MHGHESCERHGQVVAQTLLAYACGKLWSTAFGELFWLDVREEIARIENLEEKLVALFAIFAHEGREVLHRRSLDLLIAEERIHILDGIEDVVALCHFNRREVSRALRNAWFYLSHNIFILIN